MFHAYIRYVTDIDECMDRNSCEQNCSNIYGSFKCSCQTGYILMDDGHSCIGKRVLNSAYILSSMSRYVSLHLFVHIQRLG